MLIFKLFRKDEWHDLQRDGTSAGAPIDVADGYIHFSTKEQVAETAAKHFDGAKGLYLATLETETLENDLRWETSRGGALFPHLYRKLKFGDILWCRPLETGENGHEFPWDEM